MIPAIVFREGHSGHFLQAVILDRPAESAGYRMTDYYQNINSKVFLTHNTESVDRSKFSPVFRILPTYNIYNAIYNIFTKKILIEEFPKFDLSTWVDDPVFWYDKCFYHIQECYHCIKNDIATNTIKNIVDFDKLTSIDYMEQWLRQNFNITMTANRRQLINNYTKLQLEIELKDNTVTSMHEIVTQLSDSMLTQNPWFWAYAVFKFEHNNNLPESSRSWSVTQFTTPQMINDLLSYQYINLNK
jgi:hypothetical protein